LFTEALDEAPINDLRMALNQNQPIGNPRFYAQIEAITGQRRELRKWGKRGQAQFLLAFAECRAAHESTSTVFRFTLCSGATTVVPASSTSRTDMPT